MKKKESHYYYFLTEVSHWPSPLAPTPVEEPAVPRVPGAVLQHHARDPPGLPRRLGGHCSLYKAQIAHVFLPEHSSWDRSPLKCYLSYTGWKTVFVRQRSQLLKAAVFSALLAASIWKLYFTHVCKREETISKINNWFKK